MEIVIIISAIAFLIGGSILLRWVIKKVKLERIIRAEFDAWGDTRHELFNFVQTNKSHFYSPETLAKMEQLQILLADIRAFQQECDQISKEGIGVEVDQAVQDAKRKARAEGAFLFDPFQIEEWGVKGDLKMSMKMDVFFVKMEAKLQELRLRTVEVNIIFGDILPEIKRDETFLSKCNSYLEQESRLYEIAKRFNKKKMISVVEGRVEFFFLALNSDTITGLFSKKFNIKRPA